MVEIIFARRDDVDASAAWEATQQAEQFAAAALAAQQAAETARDNAELAAEAAGDSAAAALLSEQTAEYWSGIAANWAAAAEGWYNGAEYWYYQTETQAQIATDAAATLNAGATNLAGGTTGQIPVKNSNANYDFSWANPPSGTVSSVDITQPAAGITFSGGPITSAGAIIAALADDLAALEGLGTTGLAARTGTSAWATRTLTPPAAGLTISNPAGLAGNPTFALADDLAALEALATTGYLVRTGTSTFATRTFVMPAAGLTLTNTAGIAGNSTFALANDLAALEALSGTGIARRTATDTWTVGTAIATGEIADNAVTLAKLADIAAATLLGNNTGSTGDPIALTKSQAVALLDAAQLTVYGQTLAGGANTNRNYLGNSSGGGFNIDPGNGPIQLFVNGGAATISPASGKYGICTLFIQNSGGSGALAFTGYTVIGDTVGTGSSDRYICTVVQTQDVSLLIVKKYV